MNEAKVQKKIIDYLEGRRFYVVKNLATNRKGTPDIISCTPNGRFLAIEVKTEKGKLSALQKHKLQEIRNAGGYAFVCYGYEDFLHRYKNACSTN